MLVPVVGMLRVYADLLVGGTVATYRLDRATLCPRTSFGGSGLLEVAAGADLRLTREISIGLRGKVHALDQTPGWLAAQNVDFGRSADLTVALTLHI